MAEAANSDEYVLEWKKKPLGFSIVMDTTGNNAYVSSIQKKSNVEKGLKLAAQIISVNGIDVKGQTHSKILEQIKSASLPISLGFQPRSFANNPDNANSGDNYSPFLAFKGAVTNKDRVNGGFKLVTQDSELPQTECKSLKGNKAFGQPMWIRVQKSSEEPIGDDQIYCWFWPASDAANKKQTKTGENMWMISRGSQIGKGGAYACVVVELGTDGKPPSPADITKKWNVWSPDQRDFVESNIEINDTKQ